MPDTHSFETRLRWPADATQTMPPAVDFSRNNVLSGAGKPDIAASAPSVFGGDDARYNPEELLVMSLAQCHLLTYLAIAARKRITILAYEDRATGTLGVGAAGGKMSMQEVTLRPRVTVAKGTNLATAMALHDKAHANCFIANSVNFAVTHVAEIIEG